MIPKTLVNSCEKRFDPDLVKRSERIPKYATVRDFVDEKSLPGKIAARSKHLSASGRNPSQIDFERILGTNDLLDLNFFERGLTISRAVCKIHVYNERRKVIGSATGFLVTPSLLLTNHHVLSDAQQAALAEAEFDYQYDYRGVLVPTTRFRLDPTRCFQASEALDFALVAVQPHPSTGSQPLANFGSVRLEPALGKINEGEWVSIIQHPNGQPKQLAIRENELLKIDKRTLWYATDTAPGSSGSPVFNDSWQLVALHHSGVPKRDAEGRWLGPDEKPAPENPAEHQVKWIANEGIRVSSIVESLRANGRANAAIDELFAIIDGGEVSQPQSRRTPSVHRGPDAEAPNGAPRITADGEGLLVTIPVSLRIRVADGAVPFTLEAPQTAIVPAPIDSDEKFIIDPKYSARRGYDPNFLSKPVKLPSLTKEAAKGASETEDGDTELRYHHFSVVMNRPRRMCFFAASNSDRSALGQLSRKQLAKKDKWIFDERIPREDQIGSNELYGPTDFDRGHVVRREDNYWGDTELAAQYANFDTFHYTNCTPQHPDYNQSKNDGLWGELENHLAKQADQTKPQMSVFAGPVFSKSDPRIGGIQIPKQFWKIVLVDLDAGGIGTFAFLLSQKALLDDMEADFSAGPFGTYQVSVKRIEKLTEVRFDKTVHDAEVFAGSEEKSVLVRSASEIMTLTTEDRKKRASK